MSLGSLSLNPALARIPMIAFLSDRSGDEEVYILFDDGQVRPLTDNRTRTVDLDWSPDGRTVAFASNLQGGQIFDIVIIDVETEEETNLTEGKFGSNMQKPRWAPTGDPRILVESPALPGQGDHHWDIGMMDLTEEPLKIVNITHAGGEGIGQDVEGAWSPDGTMMVFQGERVGFPEGTLDIFIADMTTEIPGVNQTQITKDPEADQRARWSPDGKKIVFESKRDGDWEIFVVDIDGKNLKQLTNNDATDRNAEWSKNGIVFESKRDGNFEIYRMDPDGNNQVNLTNDPGLDGKPLWSPNGAKILFESRRDKNRELYVMDADGSNLKNLTKNSHKDTYGRWNPVYFKSSVEPQQKLITTFGEIKSTRLLQNYPNPFNPETWIPYQLAHDNHVVIRIHDANGRIIRVLYLEEKKAGTYLRKDEAAYWDGRNDKGEKVASGLYFYQLKAGDFTATKKMVISK